jgi:hypothetical protein
LKTKEEAVRELLSTCFGVDYQPTPKPKLRLKPLGASDDMPSAKIDRQISQSITELMKRTVV